jgi:hypothetical protein
MAAKTPLHLVNYLVNDGIPIDLWLFWLKYAFVLSAKDRTLKSHDQDWRF